MLRKLIVLSTFASATALLAATPDCSGKTDLAGWLPCLAADASLQHKLIGASTSQSAQPSVSNASTSMLDRTSGPDLLSAGFQLLGAGSQPDSKKSGDGVVNASAYALYTTFTAQKPLDPLVYAKGVNWRRVSFSAGYESPADSAAGAAKHKVVGAKVLILNARDAAGKHAGKVFRNALHKVGMTASVLNAASLDVQRYLYESVGHATEPGAFPLPPTPQAEAQFLNRFLDPGSFQKTISSLTAEQLGEIHRLLEQHGAGAALRAQDDALTEMVFNVRRAPQLSVSWQANLRGEGRDTNIHRAQAIFDWGVYKIFEITINGGFDYSDSRVVGGDTRAGRLAGEGRFELNQKRALAAGVTPWVLAFAAEQKWVSNADDMYKVQGRLEIPLTAGITLPLSITYASRSDLIKESEVRGQVGFTVDAAKIVNALIRR